MSGWLHTRHVINSLLLLSIVSLIVGVSAPFMTVSKFIVIDNTVSILSGLQGLYQEKNWGLFLIIGIFSLLMPAVKLIILLILNNRPTQPLKKYGHMIETYGKWSMLDVFVAAVLVVTLKLGSLVEVTIHYGIYVFSASVILSMLAATGVKKRILT